MAGDCNLPVTTTSAAAYAGWIRSIVADVLKGLDGTGTLNIPVNAIRWGSANSRREKYDGTNWNALCALYDENVKYLQGYVPADFALVGHTHAGVYMPYDADLAAFAALSSSADLFPYFSGPGTMSTLSVVAAIRTLLSQTSVANFRSAAGLAIGSNVQAYHANLAALAAQSGAADSFPYFTSASGMALLVIKSAIRTVLASADVATMRNNMGLGSAALLAAGVLANNVVQLTSAAKLPAVDGSLLTGLTASQISGLVSGGFKGMTVFTTAGSQSWTVPDGVTSADVICIGGGGGSGGAYGASSVCLTGGGGGGGYSRKIVTGLTPGASITVTVGAGGSAGANTPTAGGTGGTSSFGSHVTAAGGGGSAPITSEGDSAGGAGGAPTTSGAINITGMAGTRGDYDASPLVFPYGGRSFFGLDSTAYNTSATTPGYGAGGLYTTGRAPGYAGAPGIVVVTW